jgi:hypothetical protein
MILIYTFHPQLMPEVEGDGSSHQRHHNRGSPQHEKLSWIDIEAVLNNDYSTRCQCRILTSLRWHFKITYTTLHQDSFKGSYDASHGSSDILGKSWRPTEAQASRGLPSISAIFHLQNYCRPIRGIYWLFPLADLEKKLLVVDNGRPDVFSY